MFLTALVSTPLRSGGRLSRTRRSSPDGYGSPLTGDTGLTSSGSARPGHLSRYAPGAVGPEEQGHDGFGKSQWFRLLPEEPEGRGHQDLPDSLATPPGNQMARTNRAMTQRQRGIKLAPISPRSLRRQPFPEPDRCRGPSRTDRGPTVRSPPCRPHRRNARRPSGPAHSHRRGFCNVPPAW